MQFILILDMESESLKTIIVAKIGPNTFRANPQDIITDFLQPLNRPSHTLLQKLITILSPRFGALLGHLHIFRLFFDSDVRVVCLYKGVEIMVVIKASNDDYPCGLSKVKRGGWTKRCAH